MNFEIEVHYPIKIFSDNHISCSWATVKVGWDLKRLTTGEISAFAMDYAEQNQEFVNEHLSELALVVRSHEVNEHLNKILKALNLDIPEKNSSLWNKEWRKWRYCIMREMLKLIKDDEELLEKIEGVYADFGYPEDMKHLIYYMPLEEHEKKEYESLEPAQARKKLVEEVRQFLDKEKEIIEVESDVLPRKIY